MGQMAAPNLLVLADLIAPFIPIGLCGSLSVIAGGLSLLFPTCWRKPLPNTLDEAENRVLIPVKDRYPSFADLKHSKLDANSLSSGNVYTIPPTYVKGDVGNYQTRVVNGVDTILRQDAQSHSHEYSVNAHQQSQQVLHSVQHRPNRGVAHDDSDSRLSDLDDDIENVNWRLYAYQNSNSNETKDRDMHVFSKAAATTNVGNSHQQLVDAGINLQQTHVHRVAETNL